MLRYMLDTDTCSFVMKGRGGTLLQRFNAAADALCISAITLAELRYGVEVAPADRQARHAAAVQSFVARLATLSFDAAASAHYGAIRGDLKRRGELIGPNDMLIAAHARSGGLTLLTSSPA